MCATIGWRAARFLRRFFRYTPVRKGEHPRTHLKDFRGTLQAGGYVGFHHLWGSGKIFEAACWAHVRRKFFDLHAENASPIALEALNRIGALYGIEKKIRGQPPAGRQAQRLVRSGPLLADLKQWLLQVAAKLSAKSELAGAIRYATSRWPTLTRYRDDGNIVIDNNSAERALRVVAISRKNFLFCGSDAGGHRAAAIYSLIATAKLTASIPKLICASSSNASRSIPAISLTSSCPGTSPRFSMSMTARKPKKIDPAPLPYIESLVLDGYGDITIGRAYSIPCVAAAVDDDQQLAMLMQLLTCLDKAIGLASGHDPFIDEVNDGPDYSI